MNLLWRKGGNKTSVNKQHDPNIGKSQHLGYVQRKSRKSCINWRKRRLTYDWNGTINCRKTLGPTYKKLYSSDECLKSWAGIFRDEIEH